MKNANPTRFSPHGITGRPSTTALIAREELEHCGVLGSLHRRWSGASLHVPSALNVRSQEPVIFGAQFDFESVHKLFNLANSSRNSRRSCPNCEAVW